MTAIAVIDYDIGNLHSACKGIEKAGAEPIITSDPKIIANADGVVLPGVGAFDHCMQNLRGHNLELPVKNAIASGKPFLGICVGMQILFEGSEEGQESGLGIISGRVQRFKAEPQITIPHMGWNQLNITQPNCHLWQDLPKHPWMYFVHSYFAVPSDISVVAAYTQHGSQNATAAIAINNLMAVQFHPEKSSEMGIKVLSNFVDFVRQQ
ncbi:imidazole glycerol phosphate synthase, glutamine amidotransferase subunit [Synechococcus sp. PCC 7502]|uniref:imidazole glycerol phosphate synthase subunit HisH n=1 Tax=Synechococcus sp. PCC 7502 TaxID=1173263 RepID=UPI00029F948A|nr:imidazole glycerol phosphate synthase subunit HisH [Synechococcus sp. PCC 7502]AFY73064.1 imidazole glycerol phosphate synthase, glutamine amidotransferase subunit [Synechococcus sp. PCC 7502]